eukprot:scaffold3574_cov121-Isochrysis_galbana.AAC.7
MHWAGRAFDRAQPLTLPACRTHSSWSPGFQTWLPPPNPSPWSRGSAPATAPPRRRSAPTLHSRHNPSRTDSSIRACPRTAQAAAAAAAAAATAAGRSRPFRRYSSAATATQTLRCRCTHAPARNGRRGNDPPSRTARRCRQTRSPTQVCLDTAGACRRRSSSARGFQNPGPPSSPPRGESRHLRQAGMGRGATGIAREGWAGGALE